MHYNITMYTLMTFIFIHSGLLAADNLNQVATLSFIRTLSSEGTATFALEDPAREHHTGCFNVTRYGVRFRTECALLCFQDKNCVSFNIRFNLSEYQLFYSQPIGGSIAADCGHFRVKDLQSCNKSGPTDCADVLATGQPKSGIYQVTLGSGRARPPPLDVYCDMSSPGLGWLVIQRRTNGSEDFERNWINYTNGFGNPAREFWLGNENLYLLTSMRRQKLRIEMEDFDGQRRYAEYSDFSVNSCADNYRLNVSGYSGDAGDSLTYHSGAQFSTKDADHDSSAEGNCAKSFHGAWWYVACHRSNLNGLYLRGIHTSYADGIEWLNFRGFNYSLKTVEMKIVPYN